MFEGVDMAGLLACVSRRWSPAIGDPNLAGWLTVLDYGLCAVLAGAVLRQAAQEGRERRFWLVLCGLMLFFAVNKQLDLQSALTAAGRCVARAQGWYEDRRGFQRHFIEALLAATALCFALGLYLMRKNLRRNGLAILGLTIVAGFVATRAVGFHHFDALINKRFFDVRVNFIFENSGLILIAVNGLTLMATARGSAARSGH
jgi:hypothetical protein